MGLLQSFMILKDPHRSGRLQPEQQLASIGLHTLIVRNDRDAKHQIHSIDGLLLCTDADQVISWTTQIAAWRSIPTLWWCEGERAKGSDPPFAPHIDGILFPRMDDVQLHWSLRLAAQHHANRVQWSEERERLMAKLEERKWVDRAKAILCEIKQISEAEAYLFLRKQAMNERKRMTEVASSIVRVYELLREQK
jgi:two-component system, response regulator / RNA-binding antiterminator